MSITNFTFTPHSDGNTIFAGDSDSVFQAIQSVMQQLIDANAKTPLLPSDFSGSNQIPGTGITNSFIYIDASGNVNVISKTAFDNNVTAAASSATSAAASATSAAGSATSAAASAVAAAASAGANLPFTAQTGLTATGTNQSNALALTTDNNFKLFEFTAVAAGAGAKLFASSPAHRAIIVNRGANPLTIYPFSTGTIDGGAASAPIVIAVNQVLLLFAEDSLNNWYTTNSIFDSQLPATMTGKNINAAVGQASIWFQQVGVNNGRVYAAGGPGTDINIDSGRFITMQPTTLFQVVISGLAKLVVDANSTQVLSTTASTSSTTGALTVAGGVGIAGDTYTAGGLIFTGASKRISGDFSNATESSRLSFLSSTVNGHTIVDAIPNGTANQAAFCAYSNSDKNNSSVIRLLANGTTNVQIRSSKTGSGSYLPLVFFTSEINRLQISAAGDVSISNTTASTSSTSGALVVSGGVGIAGDTFIGGNLSLSGTSKRITGDFSNSTISNRVLVQTSSANSVTRFDVIPSGTGTTANIGAFNNSDPTNASWARVTATASDVRLESTISGTGTYLPLALYTAGTQKVHIQPGGEVGIGGVNTGAYGKLGTIGTGYVANYVQSTDASGVIAALISYSSVDGRAGCVSNHPFSIISNNTPRILVGAAGDVAVSNTTASTSSATGALTVSGGLGVGGAINSGGSVTARSGINSLGTDVNSVTQTLTGAFNYFSTPTYSGVVQTHYGTGVGGNYSANVPFANLGQVLFQNTGKGSVNTNGATLVIGCNGGESITIPASGVVTVNNSTASTSTTTGALVVTGGLGVGGAVHASSFTGNGQNLTGIQGRLLGVRVFTSSGTYTPTPGTNQIIVECVGGGGGGGGNSATGAGQCSVPNAGNGGAYCKSLITSGFSGVSYVVGAGGTGGTAGAGTGADGGSTTFMTMTAEGGGGGQGSGVTSTGSIVFSNGTALIATATGGNIINSCGGGSVHGIYTSGVVAQPRAGNSVVGIAYPSYAVSLSGKGCGGYANINSPSSSAGAGGAGSGGVIIIHEYS